MSKWWKKGTGRLYMKLVRLPLMATLVWLLYSCVFCSVHCFVLRPLVKCVLGLKRKHFLLINVTPVSLVRRSPTTPLDWTPSSATPNRRETLQSILFFYSSSSLSLSLSLSLFLRLLHVRRRFTLESSAKCYLAQGGFKGEAHCSPSSNF